jgi:hypothetical protein
MHRVLSSNRFRIRPCPTQRNHLPALFFLGGVSAFYSLQTGVCGAVQLALRYEWQMTMGSGGISVGSERINVVAHILRGIPISKARAGRKEGK